MDMKQTRRGNTMQGLAMKSMTMFLLALCLTLCVVAGLSVYTAAASEEKSPAYEGSIKLSSDEQSLASLAKISLVDAVQAALAASPGQALKAELEAELETDEDYLVYSVEILGADGKTTDVTIDAGNGKILASEVDAENDAHHKDGDHKDKHDHENDDHKDKHDKGDDDHEDNHDNGDNHHEGDEQE
jgi:uncharacterized membrane protein YkoI